MTPKHTLIVRRKPLIFVKVRNKICIIFVIVFIIGVNFVSANF